MACHYNTTDYYEYHRTWFCHHCIIPLATTAAWNHCNIRLYQLLLPSLNGSITQYSNITPESNSHQRWHLMSCQLICYIMPILLGVGMRFLLSLANTPRYIHCFQLCSNILPILLQSPAWCICTLIQDSSKVQQQARMPFYGLIHSWNWHWYVYNLFPLTQYCRLPNTNIHFADEFVKLTSILYFHSVLWVIY